MKTALTWSLLAAMLIGAACLSLTSTRTQPVKASIVRIVDGDTFVISVKGKKERVRLLHVDTEESSHPDKTKNTDFGRATTAAIRKMLPAGTEVVLQAGSGADDRDRYGRLLRYVFVPAEITGGHGAKYINYNVWLVKTGWSPYYTKYGKSKEYDAEFRAAEKYARERKLGVWRKGPLEVNTAI